MADHTHIEWADATYNPITGCSVVSPGCTNCYAMRLAGGRLQHHPSRAGLTAPSKAGPVWTGEVRLNEEWLDQPLRWKRPRRIFVCAHGDLFHESVPDAWIDRVFAVMALAPQHVFQVLTKRAARMRGYMAGRAGKLARFMVDEYLISAPDTARSNRAIFAAWPVQSIGHPDDPDDIIMARWPLPNVWLGVSAEDQARADERISDLLATPAAVRFVSLEPLIGPINLVKAKGIAWNPGGAINDGGGQMDYIEPHLSGVLHWVIAGGESGPGARPIHPDWVRQIRDDCAAAGVPFFFKQWGAHHPHGQVMADGSINALGNPDDPRWTRFSKETTWLVGKTAAGRLLDGVEHNGIPGR